MGARGKPIRLSVFRERLVVILYLAAISFTWATLAWGYPCWLALAISLIVAMYALYSTYLTNVLQRFHCNRRAQPTTMPPSTD